MDYIINHKRFKKKYSFNELDKYLWSDKRISKFPHSVPGYFEFFNDYAKKNYTLIPTKCLCDNNDDILLSKSERHCVEFPTVVCKKCGLIRAKDYFTDANTKDFLKIITERLLRIWMKITPLMRIRRYFIIVK